MQFPLVIVSSAARRCGQSCRGKPVVARARAARLRRALELALADAASRTRDLGGNAFTERFTDAIIARL